MKRNLLISSGNRDNRNYYPDYPSHNERPYLANHRAPHDFMHFQAPQFDENDTTSLYERDCDILQNSPAENVPQSPKMRVEPDIEEDSIPSAEIDRNFGPPALCRTLSQRKRTKQNVLRNLLSVSKCCSRFEMFLMTWLPAHNLRTSFLNVGI